MAANRTLDAEALSESDGEDGFDYGGVDEDDDLFGLALGDDAGDFAEEEDLATALLSLKRMSAAVRTPTTIGASASAEAKANDAADVSASAGTAAAAALCASAKNEDVRPTKIDDYVRSFLIQSKMLRSLDAFNTEWYELQSKGVVDPDAMPEVPSIYVDNDEESGGDVGQVP